MESLFANCTFNDKPIKSTNITNNSERELRRLEKQLNEHIKATKGKNANHVKLNNYTDDTTFNLKKMNDFIDLEASQKYTNKGWNTLPLSLKWKLVQEYITDNKLESALGSLKTQLTKGTLDVSYDRQKGKIVSINYSDV